MAAHSRAVVPVLGGISGSTKTICIGCGGLIARGNRVHPAVKTKHESSAVCVLVYVFRDLVVRWSQEACLVIPAFDAAVEDVVWADRERVWIKLFFALVIQAQKQSVHGIATDLGDDERCVVDHHCDLVPADGNLVLTFRGALEVLAEEQVDTTILDDFVVGVPPAVFAETDFPRWVDCPESCFSHMRYLVRVGLSIMMVTGPSLVSCTAMLA